MKRTLPLLLIFFIALIFRAYNLTEIPPGLTHDEANHGREAIGILDGDRRFYFPANYGSEPVYSYTAAFSMLLLGENLLALRLVNVLFGLGALGAAYVWAARAFDRGTAIVAAGVTAVTFWPVASSREALRAGMLPFFMVLAVWFFWQLVTNDEVKGRRSTVIAFAVSIAATLHIYLAARVTWLVFPIFLVYLALLHHDKFKKSWRPVLAGLMLAGLLVIPMFVYLQNHPEAQTRLSMLDGSLQGLREGNIAPVLNNVKEALLAFVWPGYGDQFLAYNIPGRPVFDGVTAVFFIMGLLISLRRWRQPNYAFLLLWFGIGIIPSLLTGATANTTRNLAALPAVLLLPAVGFTAVSRWVFQRLEIRDWRLDAKKSLVSSLQSPMIIIAVTWLIFAGGVTARDYFIRWGESPDVRGAYQHTLVEGLAFLEDDASDLPLVISSVYPGPAHDPSISLVLSPETGARARWVDARYGLLFPGGGNGRILIPASTPIHPALAQFVREVTAVSLRPDDRDPQFGLYELNRSSLDQWNRMEPVNFDNAVSLRAAHWLTISVRPGAVGELVTVWEVVDPERVGPAVLPFYTTDVTLFTQVLDNSGQVMVQRDALEAPSWDWQAGDIIIQIHPLTVPDGTAPGSYRTIVGLYDKLSEVRRPVITADGTILETFADVPPLQVSSP
jgi:4-amino-4-deoxy-L-arabinose transferase-like glycosyltransferase